MWPPPDGLRNAITVFGRTYSSTPGNSTQVQSFDTSELEANGWTQYATVAGQNYVPVTSPSSGLRNLVSFNGRSYSAIPGATVHAPPFDALVLEANGWSRVFSITLRPLSLGANTFAAGAAQGTFIGNILGTTPGSTLAISSQSNAGALQVANVGGNWQLQVGPSAPASANSLTVTLQEALSGAINSPNTSGLLGVTVNASGSSSLDFGNQSNSAFIAALAA